MKQALMAMEAALERGDIAACAEMIKSLPGSFSAPNVQDPAGQFDNELPLGVSTWDDFTTDDFPLFSTSHTSALSKVLTKELYKELSTTQKTVEAQGWSFNYAIRGGINCPETPVGILLGGESSYEAYSPVLVPLISLLHSGFNCATMVQPAIDPNLRDLNYWINHSENVTSPYILSAVISASRNIYGFPMVPAADRKSKKIVNFVMENAFTKKSKDLKGVYSSLNELSLYEMRNLETDNKSMLPPAPTIGTPRALVGGQKDGKDGCGYFRSDNGKIHAWVNDEDHLKLFVRDDGSKATIPAAVNLKAMIKEWAKTLVFIESVMEPSGFCFMRSERLGYVTSCPSNLGTAMRLTVTVNLAALRLTPSEAQVMGKDLNILMVPSAKADAVEGTWDLTNTVVLGYTEVEIMENFFFGLTTIIELEMKATGLVAPLAGAVAVYGSLSDEELKYVKTNEFVGTGVQKVTRTKTPEGSIDKYARRVDITSKRALEGAWINKKLGSNIFQANRYVWIDHLTKSLHWAKTTDKLLPHKALSLVTVLKIGIAPKSTLVAMGASVSGKNRGKDGEARFDLPANSIRLQLSGTETHKDIHLPPGITVAEREDWITILSDCCGFKSRQSAVNGRTTTDGLNILNTNPREFTFAPRSLSTPTKAPNNYGRKSLSLSRGLSMETGETSPINSNSPSRSMSPSELLFLAEQDNGGKPSNAVTLKVF
jgi:arginine kinase